jgi:hypothetical protein
MAGDQQVTKSLRQWCESQQWEFAAGLPSPPDMSASTINRNFRQWIEEMEQAQGTSEFRWARFIVRTGKEQGKESFVLIGGLKPGPWLRWMWRWGEIVGNEDFNADLRYRSWGSRKPVASVLREMVAGQQYAVEVGAGRKSIPVTRKEARTREQGNSRNGGKHV